MLPLMRTFGENLKRERERRKIRQVQLAEWLEKTQAQISSWEKGRRVPIAESIEQIADALSRVAPPCSPSDLLAGVLTDYDRLRGSSVPLAPPPDGEVLTPNEARAVKLVRGVPEEKQPDALAGFESVARTFRLLKRLQLSEKSARSSPTTKRKGYGKR